MHKLNIEIHPYASKFLSPRYHISQTTFTNIRDDKMEKFQEKCEACGKTDTKMELHESGIYENNCYVFDGFYLLCQKCHDMVHCVNMSSNQTGITNQHIDWTWKDYEMSKYSLFKSKLNLSTHLWKSFDNVFRFMMNDKVSADYSRVAEYGLTPENLKNGFDKRYNHFVARIRFMVWYLDWRSLNEKYRTKNEIQIDRYYAQYNEKEKVKQYEGMLKEEHLKHEKFYTENWDVLQTSKHPERERVMVEYADTIKLQPVKC